MDCGRAVAEGAPDDVYTEAILEQVYRWPVAVRLDDVTGRPRVIPRNVTPDERPGGPPP
jgi:iron complex transport system ATP-binding protein